MKRIITVVVLLLCFSNYPAIAGEKGGTPAGVDTAVMEVAANAKKWEIMYYTEQLRAIALEYTGLCFKDKRWINANQEVERLNREIKLLIKEK